MLRSRGLYARKLSLAVSLNIESVCYRESALYRTEFIALSKLAVPLVLAQLAQNATSFVDAIMVGRLGNESLAAITLGSTVFHFVNIVLCGVMFAVSPIVSQATGAGDDEQSSHALCHGLWLGTLFFVPAFVFYHNAYPLLIWLDQPPATAIASSEYLRAISWGSLPSLWLMASRGYLEGKSDMRPIMVVFFLGVLLNIGLNYVLMFGKLGLPAMGLVGTGYASSIVLAVMFLAVIAYIGIGYRAAEVFKHLFRVRMSVFWELLRVGLPIGMTLGFEMSMFSAAAIAMGTIDSHSLAAHHIALQTASISFMIPLGLAIATSVRVGLAIGSEQPQQAKVAGHVGMISCMLVMCFSAVLFWSCPRLIIGMYIEPSDPDNLAVVNLAASFLAIAALFQIFDGLQVGANGALRGLKDTTASMVLTFISYMMFGVSSGYLFCYVLELKGRGLWYGLTIGLAAAAIALSLRFHWQIKTIIAKDKTVAQDALRS